MRRTVQFRPALTSLALLAGLVVAPSLAQDASPSATIAVRETPSSFSELAKRLMPSVVNISTSQTVVTPSLPEFPDGSPLERFNEFFGRDDNGFRRQSSLGSGFVIDPDGTIVTNNHVIADADEIEVNFADGTVLSATVVGTDPDTDLAVLKVEPQSGALPAVPFADSDDAEVGDWVIAIGNPFGFGGSVSAGIISARNRDLNSGRFDDFIQTDAAINRGNSGGPLFDLDGNVVGVNTAIISPTGGSVGIGFSIPANLARRIVDQILEHGRPKRGWLGVNVQGVDEGIARSFGLTSARGALVTEVQPDSPAERAGIRVGDLLLTFNGNDIENTRGLSREVAETAIGRTITVGIVRERRQQSVQVTLSELESDEEPTTSETLPDVPETFIGANAYGLKFAAINDDARRRYRIARSVEGAFVEDVDPNGPAHGKVLKGDVIIEVQFEEISSAAEADQALQAAESQDYVLVRVNRRGRTAFYSLTREPRS